MTLSRRWVRGAVWVVLLMVGSVLARAQEVSGSISGTVMDATGASVSGAVVTLTNTDRAYVERSLKTDKIGYYMASSLPLGNYSVTIAMKGFKTTTVSGLVLHANDALKLDRKLAAGSASDTVSVVANRAALNLENGMSEGLVSGTQVRDLPLATRNYEQLLTLQPGVSYGSDTNDQLYMGGSSPSGMANLALFSINGLRPTANNWTIDGADNVNRGGAASISGANVTPLAYPSVDAISEFVTLRGSYEAEYGRSASGQINVVTNSGTNAFHGGAYEYFRNDVFNSNNYFNTMTSPHVPVPPLRYNDFGFTVGGPVVIPHHYNGRDKTFFFYSQEMRRVVQYQSLNVVCADGRGTSGRLYQCLSDKLERTVYGRNRPRGCVRVPQHRGLRHLHHYLCGHLGLYFGDVAGLYQQHLQHRSPASQRVGCRGRSRPAYFDQQPPQHLPRNAGDCAGRSCAQLEDQHLLPVYE